MALVMRTMSASCSGARVVQCGVRNVLSQYSENTCSRRASSIGDSLLRCQAATLAAVRETAAERCLDDSRAALRGSFEAASASGRSECEEGREFLSVAHHGRRGGGDWYPGLITTTPKPVKEDTRAMIDSFEAALHEAGRNAGMIASLAVRAWRKLGDADRAEKLYVKALQLAPDDSSIQASYAEFLWQCDV